MSNPNYLGTVTLLSVISTPSTSTKLLQSKELIDQLNIFLQEKKLNLFSISINSSFGETSCLGSNIPVTKAE